MVKYVMIIFEFIDMSGDLNTDFLSGKTCFLEGQYPNKLSILLICRKILRTGVITRC